MTTIETVEAFRARARAWIETNLPRRDDSTHGAWTMPEARSLQASIFDAGFAGIAVPAVYGGAGLTFEHQQAWADEVREYRIPDTLFPSIAILGMTLLDHGSEALKRRHLPRIMRGDEVWLQLLSEPSGGSDMAGAMTRAARDGGQWLLSGTKTWTSLADVADYGICLARTDWDAPKHSGLSMFAVPLVHPRVTIRPIIGSDGGPVHFFEEFFDDVDLPAEYLIGEENDGWRVARTLLVHERNAIGGVGHGLGLGGGSVPEPSKRGIADLVAHARLGGTLDDSTTHDLIAQAYVEEVVRGQLGDRVAAGLRLGALEGEWGSLLKLALAVDTLRRAEIDVAVSGPAGVIWLGDDANGPGHELPGVTWLAARGLSIGGGTNEIQRNTISERLLGMPREPAYDRDLPFRDVVRQRPEQEDGK